LVRKKLYTDGATFFLSKKTGPIFIHFEEGLGQLGGNFDL
jgi:hypothetical protein